MKYIIAGLFICLFALFLCLYFILMDLNKKVERYYHDYVVFKAHFYKFGDYDKDSIGKKNLE